MVPYLVYVLRSILRNRGRAALTMGVVAVGTVIVFSFLSLEASLWATIEGSGSDTNLIVQQANQW